MATPAHASGQRRFVAVPCSAAALASAIAVADTTPSVLRLASLCTYRLTSALPQVSGDIILLGGPGTTIKRDPATPDLRLLDVAAAGRLHVREIALLNGGTTSAPGTVIRTVVRFNQALGTATAGGGIRNVAGTVSLRRSIVGANSPDNCSPLNSVPGCAG